MNKDLIVLLQHAVLHKTVNKTVNDIFEDTNTKEKLIQSFLSDDFAKIAAKYDLAEETAVQIRKNIGMRNYRRAMHLLFFLLVYFKELKLQDNLKN